MAQDISPLENMHVSSMFRLLYGNQYLQFADRLSLESRNLMRASMIDLILGKLRLDCINFLVLVLIIKLVANCTLGMLPAPD